MPLYVRYGAEPEAFTRTLGASWRLAAARPCRAACLDITVHAHVFGRPFGAIEFMNCLEAARRYERMGVAHRSSGLGGAIQGGLGSTQRYNLGGSIDAIQRRTFGKLAAGAEEEVAAPAIAQNKPFTIGFSVNLTGPLATSGKAALLAMADLEEDINAKGGLLGRPVKLVYYDDSSSTARNTFARVRSSTDGSLLMTRDTVFSETRDRLATSLIVGLRIPGSR